MVQVKRRLKRDLCVQKKALIRFYTYRFCTKWIFISHRVEFPIIYDLFRDAFDCETCLLYKTTKVTVFFLTKLGCNKPVTPRLS